MPEEILRLTIVIAMTGQIPDKFRYEGEDYDLVGLDGESLYEPLDFGITAQMASTACWRGYQMVYDCKDGALILDEMHVRTSDKIVVNGVTPREVDESEGFSFFNTVYENLGLKTKFTGSLLFANDFISGIYVHMGFQSPESYKKVLEIHVTNGDIVEVNDISKSMAERREGKRQTPSRPRTDDEKDIEEWVKDRFSLEYESE